MSEELKVSVRTICAILCAGFPSFWKIPGLCSHEKVGDWNLWHRVAIWGEPRDEKDHDDEILYTAGISGEHNE